MRTTEVVKVQACLARPGNLNGSPRAVPAASYCARIVADGQINRLGLQVELTRPYAHEFGPWHCCFIPPRHRVDIMPYR